MSNQAFVIGDLHLGHTKVAAARGFASVKEHDEAMIETWNAVVRRRTNTVWVLGDLLFGKASFDLLPRLIGMKKLVMGNHDQYQSEEYLKHFVRLFGATEVDHMLFTHIPVHPSQFKRWPVNVHGHCHDKPLQDERYICVSAELTELAPMPLETVRRMRDDVVEALAAGCSPSGPASNSLINY